MRHLFLFMFMLLVMSSTAQTSYQYGILPGVNVNKSISEIYSLNFKAESRILFKEGVFGEEADLKTEHLLTDVSLIVSRKTFLGNSLSFGYLARFREVRATHRFIQQYAIAKRYSGFRLSHRVSADQSFTKDEPAEYRFRYRISGEFPLQGSKVDAREFYLKINNEYLNAFEDSKYDMEIRISPVIGYEINNQNKVEWGLDYRIDSFLKDAARNRFWISLNWFLKV